MITVIEGKPYRYEELCFAEQRLIPDHWPKHGVVRFVFTRGSHGDWRVATK
jgi:hypothetical protein